MEKEGESNRLTVEAREHDLRVGASAEQGLAQALFRRHELVLQALVTGQLAHEAQHERYFVRCGGPYRDGVAHG